jgi:hypothetical protein
MPGRTILDDMLAEAANDKQDQRNRDFGDQDFKEWARRWTEAKRRGGVDREVDWYANRGRYR